VVSENPKDDEFEVPQREIPSLGLLFPVRPLWIVQIARWMNKFVANPND